MECIFRTTLSLFIQTKDPCFNFNIKIHVIQVIHVIMFISNNYMGVNNCWHKKLSE